MSNYPTKDPVLVTCGLPYASGPMHIGHLRTYVPADVFVRLLKKMRADVTFVCGSDTHGTPVLVTAENEGLTPKETYEKYHKILKDTFPKLNIFFDNYGTTDDPENIHRTTQIVETLVENGHIYPKEIETPYCDTCGRSQPDRFVRGTCPYCGADARGDECDQGCGRYIEPGLIIDPRCAVCGNPTRPITRKHFFLRLSAFEDFIEDFLKGVDGTKNARNFAMGWVKEGLRDWCITRDLEWGIKFPGEDSLTLYVWVDAPIGYMSSTEQWAKKIGKPKEWEKFWKPGDGRLVHYIGLDIVQHHCIFWPAMLKGSDYNLPFAVVASGMVKIEGHNFSRGRGYVVWIAQDYLERGLDPDYLRYYMTSYTSQTKDLDFSWDAFADKVNIELVGTFGNFIYRGLHLANKHFGAVPEGKLDPKLKKEIEAALKTIAEGINEYELKKVADEVMRLASVGNNYFQANKPWSLVKEDKEKAGEVIFNALALTKALAVLVEPFMPGVAEKVWGQLGYEPETVHDAVFEDALDVPKNGAKLGKPKPVISRIDDDQLKELNQIINERVMAADAMHKGKADVKLAPIKDTISYDDFQKIDLRAGKVLKCEKVKGKDRLLKIEVDIGSEKRTMATGLGHLYKPEELEGVTALFLVNLEPKKIGGIESNGMIIAVENANKEGAWVPVRLEDIPPGSKAA
ncbi:methionine--tRNA ligase [Candidatus Thorarchaeota archaeon]|nr:MAG: methionine--tRNA ligase [Candidatus Thorarchaeota archaeon]